MADDKADDKNRQDARIQAKKDRPKSAGAVEDLTPQLSAAQAQIKELQEQLSRFDEQLKRNAADFQNHRRRSEDHQAQVVMLARNEVILGLLPVIDNFDRAFKQPVPDEVSSTNWYQGIQAIRQQFEGWLKSQGIERVVSVGTQFDPMLHEAVTTEASDQPQGKIIAEFEAGYRMGEDVLRHAKVKVSAGNQQVN